MEKTDVSVKENINIVREKIKQAAERSGRDAAQIKLVAVSKTKPANMLLEAYNEGLMSFGENYVQELCKKRDSDQLRDLPGIEWHMIGHIQTNKVKALIGKTSLIHSLDSVRLAAEIQRHAEKAGVVADVLLEINVARERDKFGFFVEETLNAIEVIGALENIKIKGLMTSAPISKTPEQNRPFFHELHELYLDINLKKIHNIHMFILSMGMSGDFETAIEEGSNMLRIGTRLFGQRETANTKETG